MLVSLFTVAVLLSTPTVWSIPIDNGVEGEPEIECGATGMTVNFNVRNNFAGHVYVKGRFNEEGCRSDEGGRKVAGIQLAFASCGTERTRSLNPRGVFVRQTVVITFHPQFLTKVDRAYTIQCFYMEAEKTVSQQIEVSEITTLFQSQTVPMPVCRYDILEGGPTGQPIKFAIIGQQVYHKWTCDTETTDIFCMVVHTCFVDDGAGNKVNLLTDDGCGIDKHLLQNLDYTTDLMAGKESHVFKYADKAALFFTCQISITIKEPGGQCVRPQCPEPGGPGAAAGAAGVAAPRSSNITIGAAKPAGAAKVTPAAPKGTAKPATPPAPGTPPPPPPPTPAKAATPPPPPTGTPAAGLAAAVQAPSAQIQDATLIDENNKEKKNLRRRRNAFEVDRLGVWDVRAQPITALDLDDTSIDSLKSLPQNRSTKPSPPAQVGDFCISPLSFGMMMGVVVISSLTAIIVCVLLCMRRQSMKMV